jgi:hypothetical protein
MLKYKYNAHYAVIHDYRDKPEELYDGELTMKYRKGMMQVSPKGNGVPYIHQDMSWMNSTGSYNCGNGKTLKYYLRHTFLHDQVWEFIIIDTPFQSPAMSFNDEDIILEACKHHYKFFRTINSYSISKFVEDVAHHLKDEKISQFEVREYANHWFMEEAPHVTQPVSISLTAEHAISANNATVLDLRSNASWLRRTIYNVYHDYRTHIFGYAALATSTALVVHRFARPLSLKYAVIDYCTKSGDGLVDKNKCSWFPRISESECKPKIRAYPALMCMHHIPAFPRNCTHNVHKAITNRMLNVIDTSDEAWDRVEIPQMLLDIADRVRRDLKPITLDDWLSNFDGKKQKRLRKELNATVEHQFKDETKTKLFLKNEATTSDSKFARCISATTADITSRIGVWINPLSKLLAERLNNDSKIFFPLSSHGEIIADYLSTFTNYLMNDFSSFDGTQSIRALALVYKFYELCGVPIDVVDIMRRDLHDIEVKTSQGIEFVAGGFRFSGRSDTLLGNTILNIIIMHHACGGHLTKFIVKGDDSVIETDHILDLKGVKETIESLGFKAKLSYTTVENVEFCSKLLVPVANGWAMGPKIGRILAKTFWIGTLTTTMLRYINNLGV